MITKCNNETCKQDCFHFNKESMENLNPEDESNCNHFWDIKHKPKKQRK